MKNVRSLGGGGDFFLTHTVYEVTACMLLSNQILDYNIMLCILSRVYSRGRVFKVYEQSIA